MKRASLVSIGNELLNGHGVNTNATYLCEKLLSCGLKVTSTYTVSDDTSEISKAIGRAAEDGDVVICTGGLGPTDDDVTRQGIAEFAQVELCVDQQSLKDIEEYFSARSYQMPERNKVQAYIPQGAKALRNGMGTAPGIRLQTKKKLIFALPGVPAEMKQMFEQYVYDELKQFAAGQVVIVEKLRCFGIGESQVAELLGSMMERDRNPLVNTTVQCGVITIHIIATAETEQKATQIAQADMKKISQILGENVFGRGNQTLAEVVGQLLRQSKKTLATAESCTGGLLAKMLTDISGSSDYFKCGWITYSNEAKLSELEIPPDIIEQYGAVSEPVAEAMAVRARSISGSDYGIGITGIAGPTGGSSEKPVGLVFIGLSCKGNCHLQQHVFSGERDVIRHRAALTALNMLRLELQV
jgi:nicotinamide-nucleotide amidase